VFWKVYTTRSQEAGRELRELGGSGGDFLKSKMDLIGELAVALGMGSIPILNGENKRLHDALVTRQIECERVKVKNQEEDESIRRIFGHVTNIKESYLATKHLVNATKETKDSEVDLRRISDIAYSRSKKDVSVTKKNINHLMTVNESLNEETGAKDTINGLLDDEHETDITTLMKWTSEVDQYEEDIFTLLKFQHQDSIKIKEHHLKLERYLAMNMNYMLALDFILTDKFVSHLQV